MADEARSENADLPRLRRLLPLILVSILAASSLFANQVHVLCESATGRVVVLEQFDVNRHTILTGPLPGPRTATVWIEENCPAQSCDVSGRCSISKADAGPVQKQQSADAHNGWVVGELTSEKVGDSPSNSSSKSANAQTFAPGAGSVGPAGSIPPGGPAGPDAGGGDLSPLINTATQAAEACSFQAALASADHLRNFDPEHPWLVANHDNLRGLANRQRTTEQTVWQASSALSAGKLKNAKKLAETAADYAVSCQNEAVSQLVKGIDLAILQRKQERNAATSRAMSALLPSLIDLSNVISGGQPRFNAPVGTTGSAAAVAAVTNAISGDRCAFQFEYRDVSSQLPTCTCAGYHFELTKFRCQQ